MYTCAGVLRSIKCPPNHFKSIPSVFEQNLPGHMPVINNEGAFMIVGASP